MWGGALRQLSHQHRDPDGSRSVVVFFSSSSCLRPFGVTSFVVYLPVRFPAVVLKVPHEVLRTEERVPLVCRGDNQTQDVFWKKDGNRPGSLGAVNLPAARR